MTAVDTEIKEVEKMFAVNVFGPMRMVRFFHPMLVAAKGTVVNIGSIGGIIPYVYGGKAGYKKKLRLMVDVQQLVIMQAKRRFIIMVTLSEWK